MATDYNSKYSGEQVEALLDQVASGNAGGGGGGGITVETDPVFSASPAASITEEKKAEWESKYSKPSGGIPKSDLSVEVQSALNAANAYQGTVTNITINGTTKTPVSGVVDLGNVGTYDKPSTGIPKSDLNSSVQTSLSKADSAVQPEDLQTEIYIADFTMESLRNGIYYSNQVDCDMQALVAAMNANKIILVRESEDSSYKGVHVLNGFAEDFLYFSIVDSEGNVLYCEGTGYANAQNYIDGQSLHMRSWNDKQDNLISGENVKTINGKSILGSGNIAIEGGTSSGEVATKEIIYVDDGVIEELEPNKVYILRANLSTMIAEIQSIVYPEENYGEYSVIISAVDEMGANRPISLTLPSYVMWPNGVVPDMSQPGYYELSITYWATANNDGYNAVLTRFNYAE